MRERLEEAQEETAGLRKQVEAYRRAGASVPARPSQLVPGNYGEAEGRLLQDVGKFVRLAFSGAAAPSKWVADILSAWGHPTSARTVDRVRDRVCEAMRAGMRASALDAVNRSAAARE